MTIRKEVLDELIRDYKNAEDLLGENGLLKHFTKALLERVRNRHCDSNGEISNDVGLKRLNTI